MKKTILLVAPFLIFFGCSEYSSRAEVFRELYIANKAQGTVRDVELWKGCLLAIEFKNGVRTGILGACEVRDVIQKYDSLVKFRNSAKALLFRGDSVFPLNSITPRVIPAVDIDSVGPFDYWDEDVVNKWYPISEFTLPASSFFITDSGTNGFWISIENIHNHRNRAFISIYDGTSKKLIVRKNFILVCDCPPEEFIWIENLKEQIKSYKDGVLHFESERCWLQ